jgi:hypothetical protein
LHVKFAAVFDHGDGHMQEEQTGISAPPIAVNPDEIVIDDGDDDEAGERQTISAPVNPDEINIEDDDDEEIVYKPPIAHQEQSKTAPVASSTANPDEIDIGDDDFDDEPTQAHPSASEAKEALKVDESVDLVEAVRKQEGDAKAFTDVLGEAGPSTIQAKGEGKEASSGRRTKFLALDKVLPGRDFIQASLF